MDIIGKRPWRDLVNVHDFYQIIGSLNLDRKSFFRSDGKQGHPAQFTPFVNPDLRTLGDIISHAFFLRIEHWQYLLERFHHCLLTIVRDYNLERDSPLMPFGNTWAKLRRNYAELRRACIIGKEAMVRNSCIALFQAYAEYRPLEEFTWLGLPSALPRNGQAIRYRIESRNEYSVAEKIAAALVNIQPLYREEIDPESAIMEKCRTKSLVLVSGPGRREVYWKNELLDVDWEANDGPWALFSALVERVKSRQGVDGTYVRGSLKDFRSRLKKLLPAELSQWIRPAGHGTYRFELDAGQVSELRISEVDRLEENSGGGTFVLVRAHG